MVPVVKVSPVSAKEKKADGGASVSFACKLSVLTSQHEGMFFRILFRGQMPDGSEVVVESRPIRVISKSDSATKKKRPANEEEEEEVAGASAPEAKAAKLSEAEKVLSEVSQLQLEVVFCWFVCLFNVC